MFCASYSADFLDADILAPLAAHYKSNVADFTLQLRHMKRLIGHKTNDKTMSIFDERCDKLVAFANFVSRYDEAFYELNRLIGIAITLPMASVEAERSFSCLRHIKSHLKTTMLDDRQSDIGVLTMHARRAYALNLDAIIVDMFANKCPNCRIVFSELTIALLLSEIQFEIYG